MSLLSFLRADRSCALRLADLIGIVAAILTYALIGPAAAAAEHLAMAPPLGRWEALRRDDLRVASVTYRLSLANAGMCRGAVVPQLGFVVNAIEQYGADDRAEAARRFGLGADIGVMASIPGSPATIAGIAAGDQLIAVNGHALLRVTDTAASDARVMAAREMLVAAMAQGAVTIRVRGSDGIRDVRFVARTGCPAVVELAPDAGVNAWADGRAVLVGAGLLKRCDSDDDLALVIAHELAHNLLHHAARLAHVHPGIGGGAAAMLQTEEEADRLGVRLAITAGYDLRGAAPFVTSLMNSIGPVAVTSTHPVTARRLALLSGDIAAATLLQSPLSRAGS